MPTTTMPLDEKLRFVFGPRRPTQVPLSDPIHQTSTSAADNKMRKWDTIESGIPNVYLLRKDRFETYFHCPPLAAADLNVSNTSSKKNDGDGIRPEHWPGAWTSKHIVWNSVGTLWAENHNTCNDYDFNIINTNATSVCNTTDLLRNISTTTLDSVEVDGQTEDDENRKEQTEPLLSEIFIVDGIEKDEEHHSMESNVGNDQNVAYDASESEDERRKAVVLEHVQRVKHELPWDYLVVYFDQCIDEKQPASTEIPSGFFDGVCTVSIRTPKQTSETSENKDNKRVFAPYLAIGSLATEKSLSEEDNEKVTKSLVRAVINLRDMISKDLTDNGAESVWHDGVAVHHDANAITKPPSFLICIAFEAQAQSYFRLRSNNIVGGDANVSADITRADSAENAYEKDFMLFWKDKIGFREASTNDTFRILRKYATPYSEEGRCYEHNSSDDEDAYDENGAVILDRNLTKKRKPASEASSMLLLDEEKKSVGSNNDDSDQNSSCSIITQTIIDEYDGVDQDENDTVKSEKLKTILEDFQSKIKLLVIE